MKKFERRGLKTQKTAYTKSCNGKELFHDYEIERKLENKKEKERERKKKKKKTKKEISKVVKRVKTNNCDFNLHCSFFSNALL